MIEEPGINSKRNSSEQSPRVLWIRTDSIGDNVLASSMLPYIREVFPESIIIGVFQERIADLYRHCPYIDDLITYDRMRACNDAQYRNELLSNINSLKVDIALNSVYSRDLLSELIVHASAAAQRIGLIGDSINIPKQLYAQARQIYSSLLPSEGTIKLELDRHRDFLSGLGIKTSSLEPVVWTAEEDEDFAENFFKNNQLLQENTLALFCGSQFPNRHYHHFGQALADIRRDSGFSVIALGVNQENDLNQKALDQIGGHTINLCGKTTILQTTAILRRCCLAVGTDTAITHLACASDTPNVIVYGGGHFGRFLPYSALTSLVCLPLDCYQCLWKCVYPTCHCVQGIDPDIVTSAISQTLNSPAKIPRIFIQDSGLWNRQSGPRWQMFDENSYSHPVDIITIDGLG